MADDAGGAVGGAFGGDGDDVDFGGGGEVGECWMGRRGRGFGGGESDFWGCEWGVGEEMGGD